jgi:hypothetical protein
LPYRSVSEKRSKQRELKLQASKTNLTKFRIIKYITLDSLTIAYYNKLKIKCIIAKYASVLALNSLNNIPPILSDIQDLTNKYYNINLLSEPFLKNNATSFIFAQNGCQFKLLKVKPQPVKQLPPVAQLPVVKPQPVAQLPPVKQLPVVKPQPVKQLPVVKPQPVAALPPRPKVSFLLVKYILRPIIIKRSYSYLKLLPLLPL